jgi:hypothetical protein
VVDESRNATFGCIDDHVLIERHQVVALAGESARIVNRTRFKTYIIVLVIFVHAAITLIFSDDFTSVLDNDLVRIKASIASNTVTSINSLNDFNTDSVFSTTFSSLLKISKSAVLAMCATCSAISIITLVEHDSVLAIHIASILW